MGCGRGRGGDPPRAPPLPVSSPAPGSGSRMWETGAGAGAGKLETLGSARSPRASVSGMVPVAAKALMELGLRPPGSLPAHPPYSPPPTPPPRVLGSMDWRPRRVGNVGIEPSLGFL